MNFHHGRYILDANWNPVPCEDLREWAHWMETSHRILAKDVDESDPKRTITVSTVFLALDHNHSEYDGSDPILWETMVFGGLLDQSQERYRTKEEALIGHQRWCERVKASLTKGHL